MIKKETEKYAQSTIFEGMTSLRALIAAKQAKINDRGIRVVYYDMEKSKKNPKEAAWLKHRGEELGFELKTVSREFIDSLTVGESHGGVAAECTQRSVLSISELISDSSRYNFTVLLEGIEDPYNFGYALRSLYAFGAEALLLPSHNWLSSGGIVARSSAGASELLKVYSGSSLEMVRALKEKGHKIICAAKENSKSVEECKISFPALLVIGGERRGISSGVIALSDEVVRIDYARETGASLSAASAAAVLGYEFMKLKGLKTNR